jgi:DNA-binding IclR family transcriptional regulator
MDVYSRIYLLTVSRIARIVLELLTPMAMTDRAKFADELEHIGKQGWAVAVNQIGYGIGGIAVPIINNRGATGAALNLLLRVPHNATTLDAAPFLEDMRTAARQIAAVIETTNPVAFKSPL